MSKMSDLSQVLAELTACGENLVRAAEAVRALFSEEGVAPSEEPVPENTAAEQPKTYTFAEVRKAFADKSHAGFTAEVKAIITKFGADKLSAVKEEDYPALMAELEALA